MTHNRLKTESIDRGYVKTKERNVRLTAASHKATNSMNIYLDISGHREYLMYHRFTPQLYRLLKNGIALEEIRRKQAEKRYVRDRSEKRYVRDRIADRFDNSIRHIIICADEYLAELMSA